MPTTKDRREYKRQYRLLHKKEIAAKFKEWSEKNKDTRGQYMREYLKSYYKAHSDVIRARSAAWYKNNRPVLLRNPKMVIPKDASEEKRKQRAENLRERYKTDERHKQLLIERNKRWRKKHPEGSNAITMKRRARLKGATIEKISRKDLTALYMAHPNCAYCDILLTKANRTIDHIKPLARGGAHVLDNLIPACRSCNSKKGSK